VTARNSHALPLQKINQSSSTAIYTTCSDAIVEGFSYTSALEASQVNMHMVQSPLYGNLVQSPKNHIKCPWPDWRQFLSQLFKPSSAMFITVTVYIYGCIYQCPSSVSRTHLSIYKQQLLSSVFGLNLHCKTKTRVAQLSLANPVAVREQAF